MQFQCNNQPILHHSYLTECHWYPWGAWGECKGICGVGVQNRVRRCQGCIPGTGACQGVHNQKKYQSYNSFFFVLNI